MLKEEEAVENKVIIGMMYYENGNAQDRQGLAALLGPGMLMVKISKPPAETDGFYKESCSFQVDDVEAKVEIMERGKFSLLKLRFLPDELREREIRNENFESTTKNRVSAALEQIKTNKQKAEEELKEVQERRQARVDLYTGKKTQLEQDCLDILQMSSYTQDCSEQSF